MSHELLQRAERATGIQLTDEKLRGEFATLLGARLIGTVCAREAVTSLRVDHRVGLWGAGWESYGELRDIQRGAIPAPALRNRIYQDATIVVFPHASPAAARGILEVLAAGGCPVTVQLGPAELSRYPVGCQFLSAVPAFRSLPDLRLLVDALKGDIERRRAVVVAAHTELLQSHTLQHAVRRIQEVTADRA